MLNARRVVIATAAGDARECSFTFVFCGLLTTLLLLTCSPAHAASSAVPPPKVEVHLGASAVTRLDDVPVLVTAGVGDSSTMLAIDKITVDGPDNCSSHLQVVSKHDDYLGYAYYPTPWKTEVRRFVTNGPSAWLSTITHLASDTDSVGVEVSYAVFTANGSRLLRTGMTHDTIPLQYQTPLVLLIVGIALGAALLTVLLAVLHKGHREPGHWAKDWAACFVVGTIVLLTTQLTKAVTLPINLEVRDFYGALVLGVLSWKLRTPLSQALGVDPPVSTTGRPKRGNDPADDSTDQDDSSS